MSPLPVPPFRMSLPSPPVSVSSPLPPESVSLPVPPSIVAGVDPVTRTLSFPFRVVVRMGVIVVAEVHVAVPAVTEQPPPPVSALPVSVTAYVVPDCVIVTVFVSSAAAYAPAAGMVPYDTAKAAVEHFANSLRLEVAHQGVDVGSAHMLWVATPMVEEPKEDSQAFREMLRKLPGPLGKTTSIEKCGEIFLKGIEERKRQINVPEWLGLFRWLKPLLTSRLGDNVTGGKHVPELMARVLATACSMNRPRSRGIGATSTLAACPLGWPTVRSPAVDMIEASDRTRPGCLVASSWAIIPPREMPTTWADSIPAASSTATASSAMSSRV